MKATIFILACLSVSGVFASPLDKRADRGSENVPGIGSHKQAILNAGGNTLDLAIAMLETKTLTTDYTYGDGKTEDASNFGLFKQNWGMLRVCATRYGLAGQPESSWNNGALLNQNVYADVASRWDCQNYYGIDRWFAGHRFGASGLADPNTADINNYKNAVYWIQQQIDSNSAYKSDDTRFWVDITPI
ncbi:hypothetical protein N7537_008457 [Penicillium hordei]|uniref:Uncharacterized protein n=1 Tax=Penicillium hordei TaxID=40994 RepID=A0AAD6E0E8_9EURO|nr:uncharacterized protein N7537_008457 [Penicillium hordei]KAJ5598373.1 hypothetical protein N7537_008457 [Penicillium hordei]